MRVTTSKSKNSESFYISKGFVNDKGVSTSVIVRKLGTLNDLLKVLYYDCSNYYFEIEQEDGNEKYGKSKEHRPNPIIQMGLFMDGNGIPLAFSLFPGNANEQTSLKPLEKKVLGEFGCQKFIYCSDAGLASESIRSFNHLGEGFFIVTQSIKKFPAEEKAWALDRNGFRRVSDDRPVDITKIPEDDTGLYYKDEPYTTKKLHQRLIVTYSPQYALYQKMNRDKQVERAQKMIDSGSTKKNRKNPNDPARFIGTIAATKDGEAADYFILRLISITSVDSLDWKDYGVDSIIKTVTQHKHLGNGSIILCHNGAKYTAQALDTLIATLKNEGYTFVPISELIYRDGYHMNHEGRQIKN